MKNSMEYEKFYKTKWKLPELCYLLLKKYTNACEEQIMEEGGFSQLSCSCICDQIDSI